MELLLFKTKEELEEEVPKVLSHLSISIHPTGYRVKEERGLEEHMKTLVSKEELLKYLEETL